MSRHPCLSSEHDPSGNMSTLQFQPMKARDRLVTSSHSTHFELCLKFMLTGRVLSMSLSGPSWVISSCMPGDFPRKKSTFKVGLHRIGAVSSSSLLTHLAFRRHMQHHPWPEHACFCSIGADFLHTSGKICSSEGMLIVVCPVHQAKLEVFKGDHNHTVAQG